MLFYYFVEKAYAKFVTYYLYAYNCLCSCIILPNIVLCLTKLSYSYYGSVR